MSAKLAFRQSVSDMRVAATQLQVVPGGVWQSLNDSERLIRVVAAGVR